MKTKIFFLVITALLVITTCSDKTNEPTADYSFPFSLEDNRITMIATIDGSIGKFFFDTGVEGIITNTPIKTLQETKRPYEHYYLLGSLHQYKAYKIDNITLYSTSFPVSTFVLNSDTKLVGFDGVIGLSVFKGYFVEVSFTDNQIRLYKTKPTRYTKKVSIYFDYQSCPYLQVNVDGINIPFLFDTGSPMNIIFPLPTANCIDRKKYQKIVSLDDDYESYRVNINYYDDGFRVFKHITGNSNPLSTLNNGALFSRNGNLGLDYIKHFDFVIDNRGYPISSLYYINRSFIANFYPGRKGVWFLNGHANAQYNKFGIDGWEIQDNKLYISSVIEKDPAFTAGIKPGTEILKINNKDVKQYSYTQLSNILLFSKKKLSLICVINRKEQEVLFK